MGKRKPVIVGNLRFGTKLAAKEWVRNLVARYPDGAVLNQDDTVFLKDLLELHPRVDEKVGSGVHSFIIDTNWEYSNTRTIFINRTDGSRTDFSWVKCIDGETSDQLQMQALRVAVMDQIIGFKQSQLLSARPITCPETGDQLSWQHCHVDHCAPDTFERLVADWLLSEGIAIEQVAISPSRDIHFTESSPMRLSVNLGGIFTIRGRGCGCSVRLPTSQLQSAKPATCSRTCIGSLTTSPIQSTMLDTTDIWKDVPGINRVVWPKPEG